MTTEEMNGLFEAEGEFLKFERVETKLSKRPDLHAFLLLDRLVPGKMDMVCSAEHDEIWLDVDADKLAEVATSADIIELIRCGVRLSDGTLCLFV